MYPQELLCVSGNLDLGKLGGLAEIDGPLALGRRLRLGVFYLRFFVPGAVVIQVDIVVDVSLADIKSSQPPGSAQLQAGLVVGSPLLTAIAFCIFLPRERRLNPLGSVSQQRPSLWSSPSYFFRKKALVLSVCQLSSAMDKEDGKGLDFSVWEMLNGLYI